MRGLFAHAAEINHVLTPRSRYRCSASSVDPGARTRPRSAPIVHLDAERLQLLHEHVERLRDARLWQVLPLHDRLVHAASTVHVVGLDRQDLLQRVRGAIRLQRPHFHLSEPLAAELRLAGERLLRDERVRSDAARVDLVVHQVRELQHVDLADGHRGRERLAAATVAQPHLAGGVMPGEAQELDRRRIDVRFRLRAEHRRERRQLVSLQHIRAAPIARRFSSCFSAALSSALRAAGSSASSPSAPWNAICARPPSCSRSASSFAAAARKSRTRWKTSRVSCDIVRAPRSFSVAASSSVRPRLAARPA